MKFSPESYKLWQSSDGWLLGWLAFPCGRMDIQLVNMCQIDQKVNNYYRTNCQAILWQRDRQTNKLTFVMMTRREKGKKNKSQKIRNGNALPKKEQRFLWQSNRTKIKRIQYKAFLCISEKIVI